MFNSCINYLLSVTQHKVFKYYNKLLEDYQITPAQAGILTCIWEQDKITPKQIGDALQLEAPTISGLLDKMQKQGLLVREIDVDNRRRIFVHTTQKADKMKEALQKVTLQMNQQVLKDFSKKEQQTLLQLLDRLTQISL